MTFTFKFDLDVLPLDVHANFQVRMLVSSVVNVVTDTHTDDAKPNTFYTSQMLGVKICLLLTQKSM